MTTLTTDIILKHGLSTNIPNLQIGELGITTDTNSLYLGTSDGNKKLTGNGLINKSVTILTTDWNTETKQARISLPIATDDCIIIAVPDNDSISTITTCGVKLCKIESGYVTFEYTTLPTVDISYNCIVSDGKFEVDGKKPGEPNGLALLDENSKILQSQLPCYSLINKSITIATTDWDSTLLTAKIAVTEVTADSIVISVPDSSSFSTVSSCGVYLSNIESGYLTFTCTTVPTADIIYSNIISQGNFDVDGKKPGEANGLATLDENGKLTFSQMPGLTEITWSELKDLRDNSKLQNGSWYCITDYVTKITDNNGSSTGSGWCKSSEYPFDIIVFATSNNTLNENAYARQHVDATYVFNGIDTWKLKYCLDNDTTRYAWADNTNGKGVIYYMKDQDNNECPYDFKNVMFRRYKISAFTSVESLVETYEGIENIGGYYENYITPCSYYKKTSYTATLSSDNIYFYTFSYFSDNIVSDYSNEIENSVLHKNNSILSCGNNTWKKYFLNNIVFINTSITMSSDNKIGPDCRLLSFGNGCTNNNFGCGCYCTTFSTNCRYNNIDSGGCNSFGSSCSFNEFINNVNNNSLNSDCMNNVLYCGGSSSFDSGCNSNCLGLNCNYNHFGQNCSYNNLDIFSSNNVFGKNCSHNILNDINSVTLGNDSYTVQYTTLFLTSNISIGQSATTTKQFYFNSTQKW